MRIGKGCRWDMDISGAWTFLTFTIVPLNFNFYQLSCLSINSNTSKCSRKYLLKTREMCSLNDDIDTFITRKIVNEVSVSLKNEQCFTGSKKYFLLEHATIMISGLKTCVSWLRGCLFGWLFLYLKQS